VAVAALEAKDDDDQGRSLKWAPTRYVSQILLVGYLITVFMLYLNVSWIDPALSSLPDQNSSAASVAMIVAMNSGIPLLPGFLNACLIIVVLSSANTALYVASRSLYTLTRGLNHDGVILERYINRLATTNERGVPAFSVLVSGAMFGIWLPFVHSTRQNREQSVSF